MNKYARIGIYTLVGNLQEVVDKVTAGALPMYKAQPGFVSYSVVKSGETTLISSSVWETAEAAQKASEMMSNWAKENLPSTVELKEDYTGEVIVSS